MSTLSQTSCGSRVAPVQVHSGSDRAREWLRYGFPLGQTGLESGFGAGLVWVKHGLRVAPIQAHSGSDKAREWLPKGFALGQTWFESGFGTGSLWVKHSWRVAPVRVRSGSDMIREWLRYGFTPGQTSVTCVFANKASLPPFFFQLLIDLFLFVFLSDYDY